MKHKTTPPDMIAALDLGSTKVCCLIAQILPHHNPAQAEHAYVYHIIGAGIVESTGVKKGWVVHMDETVQNIQKAILEAEQMAKVSVEKIIVGIAGGHIASCNTHGSIHLQRREVREEDEQKVIDAAQSIELPEHRKVLHAIVQEFGLDEQYGVRKAIGMSGSRLDAKVHLITASKSAIENIVKCIKKAGVETASLCCEPIASSEATLYPEEQHMGVALVDIGGGTCDIAVFKAGCIIFSAVLPIGGYHITQDIALAFRTSFKEAERLKIDHGCALEYLASADAVITIPGIAGREDRVIDQKALASIIEPRCEEIAVLIQKALTEGHCKELLSAGIVITGGTSELSGITELIKIICQVPVRKGMTLNTFIFSEDIKKTLSMPQFATGLGLLKYGVKNNYFECIQSQQKWGGLKKKFNKIVEIFF